MQALRLWHTGARRVRLVFATLAAALLAGLAVLAASSAGAAAPRAHAAFAQQCPQRFPAHRDQSNPLALPQPPGADPLNGARFYVPGPAKGPAAGAIAKLLGLNPKTMPVDESWAQFAHELTSGRLAGRLSGNPKLAHKVAELSKIASQPDVQRISLYSEGGSPRGIFGQTQKIFCHNLAADPGAIPVFNTYFLHAKLGGCPTAQQVRAYTPTFHRQINAMARATGRRPSVWLLEVDAIGSSRCIAKHGAIKPWEADLRYEMSKMQALPHTVVYVEAGYSDGNPVGYTARVLNAIHVNRIRGFFTNDTHNNWTIDEVRWGTRIARRTHGAHFIVNTSNNGRGPLRPHNRVKHGNEDLCNPPGRGLGPVYNPDTGFRQVDAFMWTHPPGNSSGCGGGPPGGVFWPARAIGMAERANQRLGPGYPSHPY